jgi:hypothetical protein
MRTQSMVEGYARWRAQGGKPGPKKGHVNSGKRRQQRDGPRVPRAERLRQQALAALDQAQPHIMLSEEIMQTAALAAREYLLRKEREKFYTDHKPALAVDNGASNPVGGELASEPTCEPTDKPASEPASARTPTTKLTLVHDADALAKDLANIGQLAMQKIKDTLAKPFDPKDQNYAALLRFTSSAFNTAMNTMLRSDENLLRARAIDRLPELLDRVAEEERRREARYALTLDRPSPPDDAA